MPMLTYQYDNEMDTFSFQFPDVFRQSFEVCLVVSEIQVLFEVINICVLNIHRDFSLHGTLNSLLKILQAVITIFT